MPMRWEVSLERGMSAMEMGEDGATEQDSRAATSNITAVSLTNKQYAGLTVAAAAKARIARQVRVARELEDHAVRALSGKQVLKQCMMTPVDL